MHTRDLKTNDLFMEHNNPDIFKVTDIRWSRRHGCDVLYAYNITRNLSDVEFFYTNSCYAVDLIKLQPVR